ncbi:unnamed protein product [marine sediment metagenome]|uniref:DksA C4-type domain-containing protein n=1 Tax=marine sediment metagenome TaxID=412755 RepID=X1N5Y1_9ZZZZ
MVEEQKTGNIKELTFMCKFCGEHKPLSEMRVLTRFFPYIVACQDCERKIG